MNTEFKNIVNNLIEMDIENKLHSNIRGNRNWAIKLEHYYTTNNEEKKIAYVGRYGLMYKRGFLRCYLKEIGLYGIRFYSYTYKKDLEHTITQLLENDFYIKWIQ